MVFIIHFTLRLQLQNQFLSRKQEILATPNIMRQLHTLSIQFLIMDLFSYLMLHQQTKFLQFSFQCSLIMTFYTMKSHFLTDRQ